jgi:hypothetical protein
MTNSITTALHHRDIMEIGRNRFDNHSGCDPSSIIENRTTNAAWILEVDAYLSGVRLNTTSVVDRDSGQ